MFSGLLSELTQSLPERVHVNASVDTSTDDAVRIAQSDAPETSHAVREVLDAVDAANAVFTFLFYSPRHDPDVIAGEFRRVAGGRGVAGSTAGEIGPRGFSHGSIVAMALHGGHTRAALRLVPQMRDFSLLRASSIAAELAQDLGHPLESLDPSRHIWILLLDGLSGREDFFTSFFSTHAPRLPLVGGSFGDEEQFTDVSLIHDGRVHQGAGAVMLLEYDRPFQVLHHTHLEFTDHWFEVTDTRQGGRVLAGLDDRPATTAYAEALGISADELTLDITGSSPFGFRFKGRPFPCSVMRVDRDEILLAYSVQRGDRLNLLHGDGLLPRSRDAIRNASTALRKSGGDPKGMLAFHCLGRYLEARRLGVIDELFTAMDQLPLAGLNTYGEQFGSRHMNHSLCGILFG